MPELAVRQAGTKFTEVFLRFLKTDIPSRGLPKGKRGERLILPSSARLTVVDEGLLIEVIALDAEISYYNGEPDFDEDNPTIIQIPISKDRILRLVLGGTASNWNPSAVLVVSDPGEIVESFALTFSSEEHNNPTYPIKVLAKMLNEHFGIPIEDSIPKDENGFDIPF